VGVQSRYGALQFDLMNLSDCVSKDASTAELFLVQDVLGAAAKQVSDRVTQAVLPIDGSILKIEDADLISVLSDGQVQSVIATLGVGICLEDCDPSLFNLDWLRYGKVIIACEPTAEGAYVEEQILALFHRLLAPVVAAGHVHIALPEGWVGARAPEFAASVMAPTTRRLKRLTSS
jgi:topoisomerase-4 subunit B